MPLRFKVMVLPRVAPGHGACTVPKGWTTDGLWPGLSGMAQQGPQEPPFLTWGCSEKRCTGVSGPESWGLGPFHHTGDTECWEHMYQMHPSYCALPSMS